MRNVQVVIPCHNLWDQTSALLHSLMESVDPCLRQIVVVDNQSEDETQAEAPKWEAHFWDRHRLEYVYLRYPIDLGFGAAINAGWRYRLPGWDSVVFHNDVLVRHGWLTWLQLALDVEPVLGMVSSSLAAPDVTPEQWRELPNPAPGTAALSVCFYEGDFPALFREECLVTVGEWDERRERMGNQNRDYLSRAQDAGWKFGRCTNSLVYVQRSSSMNEPPV